MKRSVAMVWILFLASVLAGAQPQTEIFGLRVYANDDEYQPPIIARSGVITIEFDVATQQPGNYQVVFRHASKDWVPDNNAFLNEPLRDRSQQMFYAASPLGVHAYTFHYKNSFPDANGVVTFPYSGNYLFAIVAKDNETALLATGKFIIVENIQPVTLRLANTYYPSGVPPLNEMLYAAVDVDVDASAKAGTAEGLMQQNVKSVYIFQNWLIDYPFRIDVDDRDADTFVENFMLPRKQFWIRNIPAGNEYRRLDLSSVKLYPNAQPVRLIDGPDQSRMFWPGKVDANGASKLRPFAGANSEYLDVEFRLKPADRQPKDVFVVGAMNRWQLLPEYKMSYDEGSGIYSLHSWIRRGVYDYQYVLGTFTSDGSVADQDWIALEGNDWRTISRYTAVVYYRDERFGGFDRAVGSAQAKSPGGRDETQLEAVKKEPPQRK
jgi:Domain of unknown function (DUF5103)